ncbi:marine proteobacterial sortase target protein [Shewanella maritima]|uniref:Marine proteobacterial sortase target protein n=1 Tax=Shewanella maritima TaxID=2520507 RepID=A0A411PD79_9GAMM|nr:marine proteobacterial sortase target protein [Shewanella maritima]QBF81503.1 marine proteobacterial sortase target protein [Shewanella maritima]
MCHGSRFRNEKLKRSCFKRYVYLVISCSLLMLFVSRFASASGHTQGQNEQLTQGLMSYQIATINTSSNTHASNNANSHGSAKDGLVQFGEPHAEQTYYALPLSTSVDINVTGMVSRVKVVQTFKNPTNHWINGEYVFPLPENAAVDSLLMHVGGNTIVGIIETKKQAKRTFEAAKAQGKQASLMQRHRSNIFSTDVANLAPQGEMQIEFYYQESLALRDGEYNLHFPMTITPRYQPKQLSEFDKPLPTMRFSAMYQNLFGQSNTASIEHTADQLSKNQLSEYELAEQRLTQHNYAALNQVINPVEINVKLDTGFELASVSSASHNIKPFQQGDAWSISLTEQATPNKDFLLSWTPMAQANVESYLFSQQGQTHVPASNATPAETKVAGVEPHKVTPTSHYQLLMVMPPQELAQAQQISRELILVIDVSGSMSGDSIRQAKQALNYALAGLTPRDRFNIIAFSDRLTQLAVEPLAVNSRNLGLGQQFVASLDANGGTEMAPALKAALTSSHSNGNVGVNADGEHQTKHQANSHKLKQVLFVTDGAVSNEQQLFHIIDTHLDDARLFTIGIGSAPNRYFMQLAALAGKGSYVYISDGQQVSERMAKLLAKLEHPALTDIKVAYQDGQIPDYWPSVIGDLYLGEPLVLSIKTDAQAQSKPLVVSGNINGQFWQRTLATDEPTQAAGLDLLWANQYVNALELTQNRANRQRVEQQIAAIGLKYHLVTSQTSLVAVDVTPVNPDPTNSVDGFVSNLLPAGFDASKQRANQSAKQHAMRLPQTATDSRLWLLIGFCLMSLGLGHVAWQWQRRKVSRTFGQYAAPVALSAAD